MDSCRGVAVLTVGRIGDCPVVRVQAAKTCVTIPRRTAQSSCCSVRTPLVPQGFGFPVRRVRSSVCRHGGGRRLQGPASSQGPALWRPIHAETFPRSGPTLLRSLPSLWCAKPPTALLALAASPLSHVSTRPRVLPLSTVRLCGPALSLPWLPSKPAAAGCNGTLRGGRHLRGHEHVEARASRPPGLRLRSSSTQDRFGAGA